LLNLIKSKAAHLISGKTAEDQACDFLIKAGMQLITRNFRCKAGELDLIMKDGSALVIVEVRYRKSDVYGSALESVTLTKQKKIIAATHYYLSAVKTDTAVRFDIVAISGSSNINWIKNAFPAN
jgi:putative endonuclease